MIVDNLSNRKRYDGLPEGFKKAFDFLESTNFETFPIGKHVIDGEKVYALIFDYDTKHYAESVLEAHKRYADVQYVASGIEYFGYVPLINQVATTPFDLEKDCTFYTEESSLTLFTENMFAIFFPTDLHMPGVHKVKPKKVRKVVVKVELATTQPEV